MSKVSVPSSITSLWQWLVPFSLGKVQSIPNGADPFPQFPPNPWVQASCQVFIQILLVPDTQRGEERDCSEKHKGHCFIAIHSKYTERVKSLSFCPRTSDCCRLSLQLWDPCKRAAGNSTSLKIQLVQYIGQGWQIFQSGVLRIKKKGGSAPHPPEHPCNRYLQLYPSQWSTGRAQKCHLPFQTTFQHSREKAGVTHADSDSTWYVVSSLVQSELLLSTYKACPFPVNWM